MSINTSIWGSTWLDDLQGKAKTTTKSMFNYVLDGNIPLNQLPDASPCYCGMYADNYLINAKVFRADKSVMPLYKIASSVNAWYLMRNYANPIVEPNHLNIDGYNQPSNRWSIISDPSELQSYCAEYSNRFIFNLQLNKLLFVPYVKCAATNSIDAEDVEFTLAAYEAAEHISKPYITGVYMKIYYNSGTDAEPTWTAAAYSADDYIFVSPITELSEDVQQLGTDFVSTFSLISSITNRANIPVMGFGETPKRDLADSGFIYNPVGLDPDTSHYIYNDASNPTKIKYCRPYSEEAIKDIWKQIAYYGVFFLGAGAGTWSDVELTSNRVFCGTIEDDGITYGNYTRGPENAEQPQFTWDNTSKSPYDPSKPVDPNVYDGSMNINALITFNTVTNRYAMNSFFYAQLTKKLWDCLSGVPAGESVSEYGLDMFLTSDPIDSIVSLKYFPLDAEESGSVSVFLGKYNTGIAASSAKTVKEYDCGYVEIFAHNDWTDYETQIMLYLPFCGTVQIDPTLYMGRKVYVSYVVDFISGNCSAAVYTYADNGRKCIIEIASGNCAIELPVTGIAQTTLDAQIYNATEQMKQMRVNNALQEVGSVFNMMQSITQGNVMGIAGAGLSAAQQMNTAIHAENIMEYELQHMQIPIKMIGTTGALTGYTMELKPTLIFIRPTLPPDMDDAAYAHTIGYAQCKPCTVGSVTGYAEFTNVDLSGFAATTQEKQMIAAALGSGVYV